MLLLRKHCLHINHSGAVDCGRLVRGTESLILPDACDDSLVLISTTGESLDRTLSSGECYIKGREASRAKSLGKVARCSNAP